MAAGSRLGASDKRAVYGIVAVVCVLIGVAMLVVQFSSRQASPPAAATVRAEAAPSPAAAPKAVAAPVARTEVAAAAPVSASAAATAALDAPPPALAPDELAPPQTAAERQARCVDILQKASLEKISAAETSFFKRECK
jgi:hypothetical protein